MKLRRTQTSAANVLTPLKASLLHWRQRPRTRVFAVGQGRQEQRRPRQAARTWAHRETRGHSGCKQEHSPTGLNATGQLGGMPGAPRNQSRRRSSQPPSPSITPPFAGGRSAFHELWVQQRVPPATRGRVSGARAAPPPPQRQPASSPSSPVRNSSAAAPLPTARPAPKPTGAPGANVQRARGTLRPSAPGPARLAPASHAVGARRVRQARQQHASPGADRRGDANQRPTIR